MAKHKVYKTNPLRKYIIISLFIFLFIGIGYSVLSTSLGLNGNISVSKYDQTLYGVFEKQYRNNYAKLYSGEHQDSMDAQASTKNIYYWNGSYNIDEMSNVIFANHCWKMFRTTDTGGVKLLYNGEADNGQCLATRDDHLIYSTMYVRNLQTSYYYGTDFSYDSNTNKYSIAGNITTGEIKEGQYTCLQTTPTGTCNAIFYIFKNIDGNKYETYNMLFGAYLNLGIFQYNNEDENISSVGYMYNKVYPLSEKNHSKFEVNNYSRTSVVNSYYSDEISYDSSTGLYSLINPQNSADLSDYNELKGKYILNSKTTTPSQSVYYILDRYTTNEYYYKLLKSGDTNVEIVIGSTYTNNGNDTYTIDNPTVYTYSEWFSGSYSGKEKKYFCIGNNSTCNNLGYIANGGLSKFSFDYFSTESHGHLFGSDVVYSNGQYTLQNPVFVWNPDDSNNLELMDYHHYTCKNMTTTCEKVYYSYENQPLYFYYLELSDGEKIADAVFNMLRAENINTKNSTVKSLIDFWYEHNLTEYNEYIEDTIFCNDRSVTALGAYNPNGGATAWAGGNNLVFRNNQYNSSELDCSSQLDRFSTLNPNAKLDYKVGLITVPEVYLIGNNQFFKNDAETWTMSPDQSFGDTAGMRIITKTGGISNSITTGESKCVRPVISLAPGLQYSSGTGTTSDPYIINTTP